MAERRAERRRNGRENRDLAGVVELGPTSLCLAREKHREQKEAMANPTRQLTLARSEGRRRVARWGEQRRLGFAAARRLGGCGLL